MSGRTLHVGYRARDSEHTARKNQPGKIIQMGINCQHMKQI
jgi:hypothetical protein